MLSTQINRRVQLKRRLSAADNPLQSDVDSTAQAFTTGGIKRRLLPAAEVATPFKPSSGVIIANNSVVVTIPQKKSGFLWDTWAYSAMSFTNDAAGFQNFTQILFSTGGDLDNRIDDLDKKISKIQLCTTLITSIIQALQVAFASAQTVSDTDYTTLQTVLSATLSGLAYASNNYSKQITDWKTTALAFKTYVTALETSQGMYLAPPSPQPQLIADVTIPIKEDKSVTAISSEDSPPLNPQDPGSFVSVADSLFYNSKQVSVMMPMQTSGNFYFPWTKFIKPWTKSETTLPNTVSSFDKLIKDLASLQVQLGNATTDCDNAKEFIQSLTSTVTAMIGIIQTAVTGSSISAKGLQIFQITISALNAIGAAFAQVASSYVTDQRNTTLTLNNDASEILAAQLKR